MREEEEKQQELPVAEKKERKPLVNEQVLQQRALGYITAREAAKIGAVSIPRIYALCEAGKIQGARRGTRRYFLRASVESYFALRTDGGRTT